MTAVRRLRDLLVDPADHPRGQPHLSAASGLVQAGRYLYVVADDEHHLGMLQADGEQPVQLLRLLPSDLPQGKEQRKRGKPDLEALALLPPHAAWPNGALLALGSGSRPQRCRAILLTLDAHGGSSASPACWMSPRCMRPYANASAISTSRAPSHRVPACTCCSVRTRGPP
jgi:hypothetical protein